MFNFLAFLENCPLEKVFKGHFGSQVKFSGWNTAPCFVLEKRTTIMEVFQWVNVCILSAVQAVSFYLVYLSDDIAVLFSDMVHW